MWYVPAVVKGPISTVLPLTCTLFTRGAEASRAGLGVVPCQVPLDKMCGNEPSSTNCSFEPFGTTTDEVVKLPGPMCTVEMLPAAAEAGLPVAVEATMAETRSAPSTSPAMPDRPLASQRGV